MAGPSTRSDRRSRRKLAPDGGIDLMARTIDPGGEGKAPPAGRHALSAVLADRRTEAVIGRVSRAASGTGTPRANTMAAATPLPLLGSIVQKDDQT